MTAVPPQPLLPVGCPWVAGPDGTQGLQQDPPVISHHPALLPWLVKAGFHLQAMHAEVTWQTLSSETQSWTHQHGWVFTRWLHAAGSASCTQPKFNSNACMVYMLWQSFQILVLHS